MDLSKFKPGDRVIFTSDYNKKSQIGVIKKAQSLKVNHIEVNGNEIFDFEVHNCEKV